MNPCFAGPNRAVPGMGERLRQRTDYRSGLPDSGHHIRRKRL